MVSLMYPSIAIALVVIAISNYSFAPNSSEQCESVLLHAGVDIGCDRGLANFKNFFNNNTRQNYELKYKLKEDDSAAVRQEKQFKLDLVIGYFELLLDDNGIDFSEIQSEELFCGVEIVKRFNDYLSRFTSGNVLDMDQLAITCKNYIGYLNIDYENKENKTVEEAFALIFYNLSLDMVTPKGIFSQQRSRLLIDQLFNFFNFTIPFLNQFTNVVSNLEEDEDGDNYESVKYYCNHSGLEKVENYLALIGDVAA